MIAFALYALGGVLMLAHCNEAERRRGTPASWWSVALLVSTWPVATVAVGAFIGVTWLRGERG